MDERVRRTQELRRSNAAQPIPGKRNEGPSMNEWDDCCSCSRCDEACASPCAPNACCHEVDR